MEKVGHFTIGVLSMLTETKANTIRFYEEVGLLPQAERTRSGRRLYTDTDRKRLTFIRHCRSFGFSVEAVRQLLAMKETGAESCQNIAHMAEEFRDEIDRKLDALRTIRHELDRMIEACPRGGVSECAIICGLESEFAPLN